MGQGVEVRGGRARVRGHQREEAARGEDAVVDTVPVLAEEHVAGDLAAEQDAVLPHLPLEERVPGLPHDGHAAVAPDVVHQDLRGLHVEDDLGAGMAGQQVAGQDGQQQVRLVPAALLVHDAHPVRVAVVGQTHVGADLGDLGHQVAHVLLHLRVGQVVREGAVRLAVELDHLAAQAPQQLGGEGARDAVARVDHHLQAAGEADVAGDGAQVVLAGIAGASPSVPALEIAGPDGGEQALDLVLGEWGRPPVHHLHAVVRHRVVAPGDGGAPVQTPVRGGEVEQRGVVHPDVHHVDPGGHHAGAEGGLELRGRDAVVHAEGHRVSAPAADERAVGASHLLEHRRRDVAAHLPAHVVGAEDVRVQRVRHAPA